MAHIHPHLTAAAAEAHAPPAARTMTHGEPEGVVVDGFLGEHPDCPVFGFNLACAYPFPPSAAEFYRPMARRLAALDPAVYVYPSWETHVTIMTFVNFSLHRRLEARRLTHLQTLIQPVAEILRRHLAGRPIRLVLERPQLTRQAAILPISDPAGEISRIRQTVSRTIEADKALHAELAASGLNAPGIVHSTVMRFKSAPADVARLRADFEQIAAAVEPAEMTITELLLTTETKPYMREGAIVRRFPLRVP